MIKTAIKNCMFNSMKLRNWTTMSNCVATHTTLINYTNSQEDISTCTEMERYKENVNKFTSLKSNNDLNNTIDCDKQNFVNMNATEAIDYLSCLYKSLYKQSHYKDVINSEKFMRICKIIHKNVRSLNNYQIVQTLQLLLFFNVPPNTLLVQTLLQLIRVSINNLSIRQIILIHRLLENQEELPLIKSLLISLPIVFHIQVEIELDSNEKIETLLSALSFACKINDLQIVTYIINSLCKKKETITLDYVTTIFYALFIMPNLSASSMDLLYKLYAVIIKNYQLLKFNEANFLLSLISSKVMNKYEYFYNKNVINVLSNVVLKKNVNFENGLIILAKLNSLYYSSTLFLDYLTKQCIENSCLLLNCSQSQIYAITKGLTIADYKPESWKILESILLKYILSTNSSIDYLATVAFHLVSLDCYSPELFEKVFTLYYSTLNNINKNTEFKVLRLHRCVKSLYPEYNGVSLKKDTINKTMAEIKKDEIPSLKESLEKVVGGAEYIKSSLKTRHGHFINYAIVIQPNGFPKIINDCINDVIFVENLTASSKCCKLLIFALPTTAYSINLQYMQSTWKIELKSVEALTRCSTIAINLNLWEKLSNYEKRTYLQHVIESKSGINLKYRNNFC